MTSHIARIVMNVADIARSQKFFSEALGFRKSRVPSFAPAPTRSAVMALGDQAIEFVEHDEPGAPYPPGSTASDLWFQHFAIRTADMAHAYERLKQCGFGPISQKGPQALPPEAGGVVAFKFRDPDGHPLELLQLPHGVHRSIAFYRLFDFEVTTRRTNTGEAQDRLDGLENVSVDVIALSVPGAPPPHLELLCYHHPRGRHTSAPGRHDIADTKLVIAVRTWPKLSAAFEAAGYAVLRDSHSAFLRDPDGHGIILTAP